MQQDVIISLDQGTTSSRTIVVNKSGKIISISQQEFTQIFPKSDWVEHDPMEILSSQMTTLKQAIKQAGVTLSQIKAIGITNQRETTVVWNKYTGKPIYNAIVWQDKRTASITSTVTRSEERRDS